MESRNCGNSLVSNAIGAGGIQHVMPLINKIARFSFFIMLGLVAVSALFPQFLLSIYTSEAALITESVPSVYVICCAMLIASVANVVFNGISGTGNTQAALLLETITIIIYGCDKHGKTNYIYRRYGLRNECGFTGVDREQELRKQCRYRY